MGEDRLVKSSFFLTTTLMRREKDSEGKEVLKVVDSRTDKTRGKEFTRSMYDDRINGIEHTIRIVNSKPEQFQINVIYILADGTHMWVWVEDDGEAAAQKNNDEGAGIQQTIESEG